MSEPTGKSKTYFVDTNILMESPEYVLSLHADGQNTVHIPATVMLELDKLKEKKAPARDAIRFLEAHPEIRVLPWTDTTKVFSTLEQACPDTHILEEVARASKVADANVVLVSNDRALRVRAAALGIQAEEHRDSHPKLCASRSVTGFTDLSKGEAAVPGNSYYKSTDGKFYFRSANADVEDEQVPEQVNLWAKFPTKNIYQTFMANLIARPDIDVVTVQSQAGYGKTFVALAAAFDAVLAKGKQFEKIVVVKNTCEVGTGLGFLPGEIGDKIWPYFQYLVDPAVKLHTVRPANKIFADKNSPQKGFDPKYFEILPLQYVRGRNIENAFVIIDEAQNLTRHEMRTILTRLGQNVKCVICGDVQQVDVSHLDEYNNGLNWVVTRFMGAPSYGHVVLRGAASRGPICDLVLKAGL